MTKRKPIGFHTDGTGIDRKVIPHFAPEGRVGRHSSFVHPSREQLHQARAKKQQIGGVTQKLKTEGFADKGIVSYINRINAVGFKTVASCSGLRRDHSMYVHDLTYKGDQTYLSVEMPEDVVQPGFSSSIHDVEPSRIKKPEYVQRVINAVHRANWNAHLSLYLMFDPTVHMSPPKTHFVQTDWDAEHEPSVIAAQEKLDKTMSSEHGMDEFNKALDERDRVREQAYIRHGGFVNRSDEDLDKAWKRLTIELEAEGVHNTIVTAPAGHFAEQDKYFEQHDPRHTTERLAAPKPLMDVDTHVHGRLARGYVFENVMISDINLPPIWNKLRYEDNRKRLKQSESMPPVFLSFQGRKPAEVEDGIHRIHAAKDEGYTQVPAIVWRE